jgi:hypothetical protein
MVYYDRTNVLILDTNAADHLSACGDWTHTHDDAHNSVDSTGNVEEDLEPHGWLQPTSGQIFFFSAARNDYRARGTV